jgi:hypothetical protein
VASLVKHAFPGHNKHNDIDHYARKYVESMETGDGKKEVAKVG